MKRVFAFLLAVCLVVLCGCSSESGQDTIASTQPSQTQPQPTQTQPQTTQPTQTQPSATDPTADTGFYNPLTGEPIQEPALLRPYAVVLNNTKKDLPQYGVGEADILYETLIEGETRMLGIYYDPVGTGAETLGTIRSARYYFIQLAQSYDAIYVHNGGSSDPEIGGYDYFKKTGWDHMDAITSKGSTKYFYSPQQDMTGHVLIRPDGIVSLAKELGFKTSREEPLNYGLKFDDDTVIIGDSAQKVKVWFNFSGTPSAKWHKSTTLTYNSEDKLYYASQYDSDYVDGNTGKTISFRNVLVLRTAISQKSGSELMYVDTVGSGTGYFVCNGQKVEINWSRENVTDPFVYTLASNGEPVTFGVGKTYVAIVPNKATVEFE